VTARLDRLSTGRKVGIVVRAWWYMASIRFALVRRSLPEVVRQVSADAAGRRPPVRPFRLGRIVHRSLTLGPLKTRCLYTSLVTFRMLREQGDPAELVLGLPERPEDKDAHAWVEVDGYDIGPPPGGAGYVELARYA
jgi:hypothetical protein